MKSLIFKKLMILSEQEQKGVHLTFDRINVVIGSDNSVGKSTLVKNLFWALGCNPYFDDNWKGTESKTVIEFSVNDKVYLCARDTSRIMIGEKGKQLTIYTSLTGDYAEHFASIVGFNALLPARESSIATIPPAAFYFLPFYIDQKRGWIEAWDSFNDLKQYSRWTADIIPYHCGAFTKEYFQFTDEMYEVEREKVDVNNEVTRIDTAISVVDEFIPKITTTVDKSELDEIKVELEKDLAELHSFQEVLFEEIAGLKANRKHQEIQLRIAETSLEESELDYEYALEHASEVELECPTCGTIYDNTLVDRFSLLQDQEQSKQVCLRIQHEIESIDSELSEKLTELDGVKNRIDELNKKYYREEKETKFDLSTILDSVAAHSVRYRVESSRQKNIVKLSDLTEKKKGLGKDRTKAVKERKKESYDKFQEIFPSLVTKLGAHGVQTSQIKSPMTHKKVAVSGGAAEGTRALLAYYLSIYKLSYLFSETALAPLVVDTPKQQEQAGMRYEVIVQSLLENIPEGAQVFLCGMDDPALEPMTSKGKTFYLENERSLLREEEFKVVKQAIGSLFE
ncbi:hypothetical protein [Pseudoalteromonas ardens]|uniref:hypothetical protein n=1 Tax=Pseudoalteromonas ardens TaxID=3048490 RepID=UPI0024C22FC7|nr:hypothetical protein [Pseudoalteromonas sp. R96]MDK1312081.1 hypothetical protein [Pseudoalteromonas sp. R96]